LALCDCGNPFAEAIVSVTSLFIGPRLIRPALIAEPAALSGSVAMRREVLGVFPDGAACKRMTHATLSHWSIQTSAAQLRN
jgi:hypothetical protein